ncbi:hypothetical protein THAOC_05811 [Thalassiosira oceanica]|uniref:Uncharacterized protein n=1 Tax=Thalassiosira oceanica TaxID=159749 RepID=K0T1X6_THAOC|nr:hypothetical protein THAOC_05811 [Thalassiosira oceanica]|eukprot:EJK72638.1 hypothetical protein THAOC_05811 [Thalassiosira oceanica]
MVYTQWGASARTRNWLTGVGADTAVQSKQSQSKQYPRPSPKLEHKLEQWSISEDEPEVERRDTAPAVGLDRRSDPPASPTPAVVPPRPVRGHFYGEKGVILPGAHRRRPVHLVLAASPPCPSIRRRAGRPDHARLKAVRKGDDLFSELVEDERLNFFQEAWRHKDCPYMCMTINLDGKGRCKKRSGGGRRSSHDQRAVIEDEEKFRGRVILRLGSHWGGRGGEGGGCLDVSCDEELSVAAKQMKLADKLVLDLKDGRVFTCCQGDGCDKCFVRKSRANASTQCDQCRHAKHNSGRYAKRREQNRDIRVDPKSTVPLTSLSSQELTQRAASLNRNRKVASKRLQRLIDRFNDYKSSTAEREVSDEMRKHMVEAANDLVDACEKQTIPERLQALIDDIVEESPHENNEPISQHDAHRFVQSLAGHLKNWVKDQQGHSSAVRFDDDAFALAFNHFLRCPASYRQMRSDDCLVRPSESLFKKLKKDIGVKGGQSFNTAILQPFVRGDNGREEDSADASAFMVDGVGLGINWSEWRSGCGSEWGEVACDEATISQGMVTNSKNNVSRGITNDFFELRRVMSNITDSDTIESMDRPATKVNQWWFRATNGRMFCVMSFFNSGSLSGDVILRQLIAVIMACEAVGSRVFLFACDAGGANQGTFKSLRGNKAIPDEMVWLDDEYIRFINPYDTSRWIYLTHCSTHNLKNMRNRVKESKADGSKCFLDANGNMISWDFVQQIYNEEQLLIDGTGTPTSGLTDKAVYPDRWSTMNAQNAKAPFAPKALFAMLAVIHRELKVSKDEAYRVVDHYKVIKELEVIKKSGMNEKAARMIGYFTTVAKRLWDLFKARCPDNLNLAGKIATIRMLRRDRRDSIHRQSRTEVVPRIIWRQGWNESDRFYRLLPCGEGHTADKGQESPREEYSDREPQSNAAPPTG